MLLALDTSAAVSVALLRDGQVVAAEHRYDPRRHAELLTPFITDVLDQAGAQVGDVTGICVGQGPGPFTGLRVALVTARVLGLTAGLRPHGVCSLDGLALAATRDLGLAEGREIVVATDARRKEVYSARYRIADECPVRLSGPVVGKAHDIDVAGAVCVGRGVLLYPDALPPATDLAARGLLDPSAADLARVGAAELADGVEPRDPSPLYLRRPDATEPAPPS